MTGRNLGNVDVRATYLENLSPAATLTVLPVPNRAPDVRLTCPESGREGEALDFTAAGSSDADGEIVRYTWDFGDGNPVVDTGDNQQIAYSFMDDGPFVVTLTAEDDAGARASTQCDVSILSANAPRVQLIRPQGNRVVTQGETLEALVDARPGPGRNIASTSLLLDGVEVATDENLPYEMTFDIPIEAATGASLRLVARAVDDTGDVGLSSPVLLEVVNALPVATFLAIPTADQTVRVDANGVSDDHTPNEELQVRWDWEDDGEWDTAFGVEKAAVHEYPDNGEYTIRMQVRDGIGQVSSTTREVAFLGRQVVGGDIDESVVWAGTIIVTGHTRLLAGHTLTIAPGTRILFTFSDQNDDDVGDYGLEILGNMQVQGVANNPVVFTAGGDEPGPDLWNRILLNGDAPSSIEHAQISYGNVGVEVRDDSSLSNVTIQQTGSMGLYFNDADNSSVAAVSVRGTGIGARWVGTTGFTANGLYISETSENGMTVGSSNLTLDDVSVRDAARYGLEQASSTTVFDNATVESAGWDCVAVLDGSLTWRDGRMGLCGRRGLWVRGSTAGLVTRTHITENAWEGVAVLAHEIRNPTIAVVRNNIHSNASELAHRYGIAVGTLSSASDNVRDGRSVTGGFWTAPNGGLISWIELTVAGNSSDRGWAENTGGTRIGGQYGPESTNRFSAGETPRVRAEANDDGSCCATAVARITKAFYGWTVQEPLQLVIAHEGGTTNARENYLGVFPEVLESVAFSAHDKVDIQGFVGVPFPGSGDWDLPPYYGGPLEGDVVWSDTVYVTGDVTVPADGSLTIEAGTTVRVAPVDQNADGIGDYQILGLGPIAVNGAADARVTFRAESPQGLASDWHTLRFQGAGSVMRWGIVEHANTGIYSNTDLLVEDTTVRRSHVGIRISGGGPTFRRIVVRDGSGDGVHATHPGTIEVAQIRGNDGRGVFMQSGALSIADATITENDGVGVDVTGTGNAVSFSEISFNGDQGVQVVGNAGISVTDSLVTFNAGAGFWFRTVGDSHPTATVNRSNVLSNAAQDGVGTYRVGTGNANVTASDNVRDGRAVSSGFYTAPGGATILEVTGSFTGNSSDRGYVQRAGGTTVATLSPNQSGWYAVNSPQVRAQANDNGSCCATATMRITTVRYQNSGIQGLEMAAGLFAANRVDARGNYWGNWDDVNFRFEPVTDDLVEETTDGSIDYSNAAIEAIPGVGPREAP